ncbi:MAG: helix-turn-helix domain-containing protein [Muribaculaceae bacterium]|nr:helix-turn-helix domain-containing protein [Muribaculaceae bacterium]
MNKPLISLGFILCIISLTVGVKAVNAPKRMHYDVRSGLSSSIVGGGVQDRNGLMWFATWNGLICYDGYDFHLVNIRPGDGASISTNRIRDIILSDEGNIVCRTDDDIYEFDLSTYTFRDLTPSEKSRLKEKVGRPWHGITDNQGNFWIADNSGLYKTSMPHHPAKILPGTENEQPRAFMQDNDGQLWVGMRLHPGISVYSPDGSILRQRIELDNTPYCIYQTRNGNIWVGCKPGSLIKLGHGLVSDDVIYDMAEDSRGRLWLATFGAGVKVCTNPESDNPSISSSLGGNRVRKLLITPSDNLIAATSNGLLIGHINNDRVEETQFINLHRDGNNPASLCSDATMSIARDSKGMIYISTESSGVDMINEDNLFSSDPVFTHLGGANSVLADDIGKAMALSADTLLMVVGNDNVKALNPKNLKSITLSNVFWGDSCDFIETTPLMLDNGSWLFGASQGAFIASHHAIYSRGYIPSIVFTTLSINGGSEDFCLPSRNSISLESDERNITIHFAALDYIDNTDILYCTRLDGSPWTTASRARSVTLFNLSPGNHILEVQSTDRYGRQVENAVSLNIYVASYWYETWWARVLFAVVLLAIVGVIIGTIIYIRRVNRQRRELLDKYMVMLSENETVSEDITAGQPTEIEMIVDQQSPEDIAFLGKVRGYIEENMANPDANVDDMGLAVAASRSTLNRRLRSLLGVSASKLMNEARMQHAAKLLKEYSNSECPIAKVAEICGYSDKYYFSRVFQKKYGVTPTDYRAS